MPKIQNQIKFYKYITNAGVFALATLVLLTLDILIPIKLSDETAVAAGDSTSTTSLTLDVASSTAGVELLVTSDSGTFASTASGDEMTFNATTNNVTGYMLSISAKSGTDLTNSVAGTKFTSLSNNNGVDSTTFDTTIYNNMWGFKPNYYKSTANNDKFYPSPTTSGVTLNKTESANTSGSYDTYTIAIGARATYSQVAGTYSNTYILNAVGNYPEYKITYNDTSGESEDLPSTQEATSETNDKTTINFSDIIPTRDGYEFVGWCSVDNSADPTSCNGTTYAAGDEYALSTLSSNIVPLYAIWAKKIYMQNLSTSECVTTSATKVYDNRDETAYYIQRLADGKCWLLNNLALDLTDANVQSKLNSSTTNATNTDINYLLNGGGTASNQYAITGVATWASSDSYSQALIATDGLVDGAEWSTDTTVIWAAGVDSIDGKIGGKIGVYYNLCAATAGTYCYGDGTSWGAPSGNATADICPAGWRLPTGGPNGEYKALYEAYGSNASAFTVAFRFPLSGLFSSGVPNRQNVLSQAWSSTKYDYNGTYDLFANTTIIHPTNNRVRYGGESVRCVMRDPSEYLQNATEDSLTTRLPNVGDTTTLYDIRDSNAYTVGYLADGNYWLLDNLRLGGNGPIELTSANTNIASGTTFALPGSTSTGFAWDATSFTAPAINTSKVGATETYENIIMDYGVYYNYCAASAGTYCYASGSGVGNAEYDICPTGWRMPTSGAGGEYRALYANSNYNTYAKLKAGLHLPLSGRFENGSAEGQDDYGVFWASTYGGLSDMYRLYIYDMNGSSGLQWGNWARSSGISVRCLFRESH